MPSAIRLLLPSLACALLTQVSAANAQSESRDAVQAEIWAKELAIYAGRGHGDLGPYLRNTATDFASWPPQTAMPVDLAALKASEEKASKSHEKLELTFVSLRLNGDAAVIYYRTHMTVLPNGNPTDDYYEVTHTWVKEKGQWRVFGGMARPVSKPAS